MLVQLLKIEVTHLQDCELVEPAVALGEVLRVVPFQFGLNAELFDGHAPGIFESLGIESGGESLRPPLAARLVGHHVEDLGHHPATEETIVGNGTVAHDGVEDRVVIGYDGELSVLNSCEGFFTGYTGH